MDKNHFNLLINHPKATPEKINKMKKNSWTMKEIAEKFAYMEKMHNFIDSKLGDEIQITEH
jgi:hypothetical protein|tara:strand:+ start:2962 stop:3144 length:183 start_codon:yes stop_codon:yes gene_type:complete